jgi:hypothetical protein
MAERPRISSPEVVAYLDELVEIGIYGRNSSAVATWIVRKEIMRLVEEGVLRAIPPKALAAAVAAQGPDEASAGGKPGKLGKKGPTDPTQGPT